MKKIYSLGIGFSALLATFLFVQPEFSFATRSIEPHGTALPATEQSASTVDPLKAELLKNQYGDKLFIDYYTLGKEKAELQNKAQAISDLHEEKQGAIKDLQSLLKSIDLDIEDTERRKDETSFQIQQTSAEIDQTNKNIQDRTTELEGQKKLLGTYLKSLYDEKTTSTLEILLRSDTFSDALDKTHNLETLESSGQELYTHVTDLTQQLLTEKQSLLSARQKLTQLHNQLDLDTEALQNEHARKEVLLADTQNQEVMYQRLLAAAQDEAEKADAQLSSMHDVINTIQDPAGKQKLNTLASQFKDGFSPSGTNSFQWPVDPSRGITAFFQDVSYELLFGQPHHAIDIREYQGTPIHAVQDGYVFKAVDHGYGYSYIVLVHNRTISTVYGHVSSFAVKEGDLVKQGQIIGTTGGMPGSKGAGRMTTGPHLHFEVRENGTPVDPLKYLPEHYQP